MRKLLKVTCYKNDELQKVSDDYLTVDSARATYRFPDLPGTGGEATVCSDGGDQSIHTVHTGHALPLIHSGIYCRDASF